MRQISVGAVQLQHFESRIQSTARGCGEGIHNGANSAVIQRSGNGVTLAEGYCTGRDSFPTAGLHRNGSAAFFPGNVTARFSSGMGQLKSGCSSAFFDKCRYARQRRNMFVFPDSLIGWSDAPASFDGTGLRHHQSRAAYCPAPQMHQVPIPCESVDAGILAHRRNGDAIPESDFTDGQGIK